MDDKRLQSETVAVAEESRGLSFGAKAMLSAILAAGLFVLWLIGSAVVPRWWAQRVSNVIDGRLTVGSLIGLGIGATCTLIPLLLLWAGWRFRRRPKRALVFLVVAVIVAAPNLATLGIVLGSGNAAHAGERILDVDGPGFRGGSLVGAILGALAAFIVMWLSLSRKQNKRKARRLEADLANRDDA